MKPSWRHGAGARGQRRDGQCAGPRWGDVHQHDGFHLGDVRDSSFSQIMQTPVVWLASEASHGLNGQRIIAYYWDERLPIEERLQHASAPAAWPQLGRQAIFPGR
jgi:hypothetical protein